MEKVDEPARDSAAEDEEGRREVAALDATPPSPRPIDQSLISSDGAQHEFPVPETENQLKELEEQNNMLLNQLAAAKRQIADMEKQLPDFKPSLVPDSTDLREARILELAKKNRSLMVSFQRERDKAAHLSKVVFRAGDQKDADLCKQLQQELKNKEGKGSSEATEADGTTTPAISVEQDLRDKLAQANARAADRQHMVEQLKRELARAHKALLRELGDVPLAKALDEGAGGWRGRAQEISLLKSQLKELRVQLANATPNRTPPSPPSSSGAATSAPGVTVTTPAEADSGTKDFDAEHKNQITAAEHKRIQELEELQARLQAVTAELASAKAKMGPLNARCKILETDNRLLRQRVEALAAKSAHDDELIRTQQEAVAALRKHLGSASATAAAPSPSAPTTKPSSATLQASGDPHAAAPSAPSSGPLPSARSLSDGVENSQVLVMQERQIARQEQIIRSLQAELEALQGAASAAPPYAGPGATGSATAAAAATSAAMVAAAAMAGRASGAFAGTGAP